MHFQHQVGMILMLGTVVAACRPSKVPDPWEKTGVMAIREANKIVALSDVRLPQPDSDQLPQRIEHPISLQLGHFAAKEWPLLYFQKFISQLPPELNGLVLLSDFSADRVAIINAHFKCVQFLQVDESLNSEIKIPICGEGVKGIKREAPSEFKE